MKDYFGYSGKTCVVVGGATGIGKATVEALVELGAKVYVLDIKEVDVEGIEAYIPTNTADKESIDSAFAQLPEKIDRFFSIAGVSSPDFMLNLKVDFISPKYITETYLKDRMAESGAIVYTSSDSATAWNDQKYRDEYWPLIEASSYEEMISAGEDLAAQYPYGGFFGYIVAKRALNFYASSKCRDFAPKDVRVNFMLPTSTRTNMMQEYVDSNGNDDVYKDYIGNGKPFAQPEDMAKALIYLNSDMASYVSGLDLYADWGLEAAIRTNQVESTLGMTAKEQYSGMMAMIAAMQQNQ